MVVASKRKRLGAFYTPESVAKTLVRWVAPQRSETLLDPSCGDGRFLAEHSSSFGVELDAGAASSALARASHACVHVGDLFEWAEKTTKRFECAAGNPPFIRYQRFSGSMRARALQLCARFGVEFSSLTSSWAPFLAVTASLLKQGGRMAFVVPAEIGHAPYAAPLVRYLAGRFARVQIVAVRDKVYPELSEDVWFLYAEGCGGKTDSLLITERTRLSPMDSEPPARGRRVRLSEWESWNCRLRPFFLPARARELYRAFVDSDETVRMSEVAKVRIGYVTGANEFFHLRPSEAARWRVPKRCLLPTVRNSRVLPADRVSDATINQWMERDDPVLLLRLGREGRLPNSVVHYLDSPSGHQARQSYKCRSRSPWYSVPDVRIPDGFLSYMSGITPQLVINGAACSCTNTVHAVDLVGRYAMSTVQRMWHTPLTRLSCEIEGHPLGGGILKLEPREAARVLLARPRLRLDDSEKEVIEGAVEMLRRWRHSGA